MTVPIWAAAIQTISVVVAVLAFLHAVRSEAQARRSATERDEEARRREDERSRRDRLTEIRVRFLHDAYVKLALIASIRSIGAAQALPMVEALKDIQLLGTPEQVALADEVAVDFARDGGADLDPLLDSLYNEFRAALDIAPATRSRLVLSVFDPPERNSGETKSHG